MQVLEKRPHIWALLTVLSIFGFYSISDCIAGSATNYAFTLNSLAQQDLAQLKNSKKLPDGMGDLFEIEKVSTDRVTKSWARHLDLNLHTQPAGAYKLEVLLLQEESEQLTAILQYHLIHRASGNSVWEIARQYKLFPE